MIRPAVLVGLWAIGAVFTYAGANQTQPIAPLNVDRFEVGSRKGPGIRLLSNGSLGLQVGQNQYEVGTNNNLVLQYAHTAMGPVDQLRVADVKATSLAYGRIGGQVDERVLTDGLALHRLGAAPDWFDRRELRAEGVRWRIGDRVQIFTLPGGTERE